MWQDSGDGTSTWRDRVNAIKLHDLPRCPSMSADRAHQCDLPDGHVGCCESWPYHRTTAKPRPNARWWKENSK